LRGAGTHHWQYRLELRTPLDHRIRVTDPFTGRGREMICFDSNSYLGLHLHPRVTARVRAAVKEMGYGTPSAQLLGGNNTLLRQLEETLAAWFGREAALVYSTGYQTNIGVLTGLLRPGDLVLYDQYSHMSIQDGCRWSGARAVPYAHNDLDDLRQKLVAHRDGARGALIVTDGVFSMHGSIADLPGLRAVADTFEARLMIDEAHSLGVLGDSGQGLEEEFGMAGAIDLLMGTFSKAPGAIGGYIAGPAAMVDYLRFFSHPSVFTASLPAQICAGLIEALSVMRSEPWHRERLWRNARRLWAGLAEAGYGLRALESPIVAVPVGEESVLAAVGRDLFRAGIKCGVVQYPAVPRGASMLRLTVCSRHTDADLDRTVEVLAAVGRRHGLLAGEAA
ncbi:MAG: aminotransferase class I/II-fold pyridoxal phosphate-dependent enzyme, partial [Gammaproteobacteria bacterium]|nr:pyridoxal phosphate-dependent aminotransferase family protein [Gemmatimonadota bacterium]NIU79604.1 aminotransferase class I/II-fold pyridoxal phosphate-dependent enzyme [Gammaproteobacteria bacterium]